MQNLQYLKRVTLDNNHLEVLPNWIAELGLKISVSEEDRYKTGYLTLANNPIKIPPPEILKQGNEAIRNYFKSLQGQETVILNEVKVMLVGEGMAGKTSLLKQLQGLPFDQDESQTHGINVLTVAAKSIPGLQNTPHLSECDLHCWDFGGQEIMHASHQFFMSERAVYILMLDSRTDSKKYHWLTHIQKFGGQSPLLVALNKIDVNPNYNVEQKKINEAFPTIKNRFYRISCHTGEGLAQLIDGLANAIPETTLFGTEISQGWMTVKDKLVQQTKANHYLSRAAFEAICATNGVTDKSSQGTLLQFLHDLGIVLYFKQLSLANIYVLDPHWVTIGVYKIITSGHIQEGRLKEIDLDYILNEETTKKNEYDPANLKDIHYNPEEQRYIVAIMTQFELAYEYDKAEGVYIVPDLLPKELANEPELGGDNLLRFVLRYDYLPRPVISRLMLRLKGDIVAGEQWRYGMVLSNADKGCRAIVTADEYAKTISIVIEGEPHRKREYFSVIRHHILDINNDFKNLVVEELIPLPDHPHIMLEYAELLGYEQMGEDTYLVGKLRKSYSVSNLLDSVASKTDRLLDKRAAQPNYAVHVHNKMQVAQIHRPETHLAQVQQNRLEIEPNQRDEAEIVAEVATKFKQLYEKEETVKEALTKCEKKQALCQKEAEEQIELEKRFIWLGNAVINIILVVLIAVYGFGIIEQVTFIVGGVIVSIVSSVISLIFYRKVYLDDGLEKKLQDKLQKTYIKHSYDAKEHARLKGELEWVKQQYYGF